MRLYLTDGIVFEGKNGRLENFNSDSVYFEHRGYTGKINKWEGAEERERERTGTNGRCPD